MRAARRGAATEAMRRRDGARPMTRFLRWLFVCRRAPCRRSKHGCFDPTCPDFLVPVPD